MPTAPPPLPGSPPPLPATPAEAVAPVRDVIAGLLASYNTSIWPIQLVALLLATGALLTVLIKPGAFSDVAVKVVLDFMWLWTGAAFFVIRLAETYSEAYLYGALFILQGTFFLVDCLYGAVEFRPFESKGRGVLGIILFGAVVAGQPVLSYALRRGWPTLELAGTTPGATAALTLIFLTFSLHKPRLLFFLIPAAWTLTSALQLAFGWGYYEQLIGGAAGLTTIILFATSYFRPDRPAPAAAQGA